MTQLDVCFRYGLAPGEPEMLGISRMREVYGIRSVRFNEAEQTVTVEYDATRLTDDIVASLLRRAGIDLREKVELVR
ncbi:MAG: hypothetical protein JOZ43_02065 [Acidobacteriales bacterium]|nr:hypothetical protein [Terriglobales bacterium]